MPWLPSMTLKSGSGAMKLREAENVLVVEGQDDLFTVIGLMEHHCQWPNGPPWPVFVEAAGSDTEILRKGYLSGILKSTRALRVGVILDADDKGAHRRFQALRSLCLELFPSLPQILPETGLVVENDDGKRFGFWVMPDNRAQGIMEDFLTPLVPASQAPVWDVAGQSVEVAVSAGANCSGQRKKAQLFTFLAWQEEPGRSPGQALMKKHLDPFAPQASAFVAWFKMLFGV